uniref:Uncharacterized protein n=1 Tax=Arundo donax TaxID=35708 RepID=A0A0A9F339_ARUDO
MGAPPRSGPTRPSPSRTSSRPPSGTRSRRSCSGGCGATAPPRRSG